MKSKKKKNKYLWVALAGSVIAFFAATKGASDPGEWLLQNRGPSVVMLTPVDRNDTGATGFEVRTRLGNVVTVTNAHVCRLGGPDLKAHLKGGKERPIRILQISEETDLCVLEGIPGQPVLGLADWMDARKQIYVLGHPHLAALTLSQGYVRTYQEVKIIADERDLEHCNSGMFSPEKAPGFFGEEETVCVAHIWAYDSSAIIYPGNSGSPVLDRDGEVVGVMFAGDRRSNTGSFIGLEDLKKFLESY